jgi:signal transduction histidine kinase
MVLGLTTYLANRETAGLLDNGLSRLQSITSIQENILETQRRYRRSMRSLQGNQSEPSTRLENFFSTNELKRRVAEILIELEGLPEADRLAEEFTLNYSTLQTTHEHLIEALKSNDTVSLSLAYQNWQNAQTNNELILTDMVAMAKIRLNQTYSHIKTQQRMTQYGLLGILGFSILYILFATRHFLTTIVKPIEYLSHRAKEFSEGQRTPLTELPYQDEIGVLSRNMREMQKKVIDAESDLKAANAKLERFAAVTAHDLKSPISTGLGFLDLLVPEIQGQESARHYVARARKVLERSLETIESLLTLSSGSQKSLLKTWFKCDQVVKDVLEDLNLEISSANASISRSTQGELHADKGLFRELLRNLLTNSIKYSRPNLTPKIKISTKKVSYKEKDYLSLIVEDNGIGMGEDCKTSLLKPFSRGATNKTKSVGGVGLGLTVCNEILLAHDGHLLFEPSPTGGTIVKALFPCNGEAPQTESIATIPLDFDTKELLGKRVLLVDDDPHVRLIVGLHLSKLGIHVIKGKDGNEALSLLDESMPDVVITDLQMPGCDGKGLLKGIQDRGFKVPVIALSGEYRASDRTKFIDHGFSDCLQKGATPTMLYQSISHCLSKDLPIH